MAHGSTKVANPFYTSNAWRGVRMKVLARDRWCCVWCFASVRGKGRARVDHIKELLEFPELALDMSNLRTLCIDCDAKRHRSKGGHNRLGDKVEPQPCDEDGYPAGWR